MAIDLSYIRPGAMLADLPVHEIRFDDTVLGAKVAAAFQAHPELPGVIVDRVQGAPSVVSRQKFFQELSIQYSREVYLGRPISIFVSNRCGEPLRLDSDCPINDAVRMALSRSGGCVYDPLLVRWETGKVALLDLLVLLQAQSSLLATMHVAMLQSEKLASLGQLAAGIAHEINNPLAFVKNNNAVLQRDISALNRVVSLYQRANPLIAARDPVLAEEIGELSNRIDLPYTLPNLAEMLSRSGEGLRRIQEIVQNLRDFVRLDHNDFQEADLNEGIESTVNMIRHRADGRRIRINTHLDPLPKIPCYLDQINQVVMNLLSNAIDASEEGSEIEVRSAQYDDAACVEVIDHGVGIDPGIRARIFDPFFTTKPIGQGSGMGLSISYGIVKKHGGEIEVDSEIGHGSTFRLRLPTQFKPTHREIHEEVTNH